MPLRPCPTCRKPVPNGRCPTHPPTSHRYRPQRTPTTNRVYHNSTYRALRLAILTNAHWTCAYCHQPATTTDHIHPHSRGGPTTANNMAAACRTCNSSKRNLTLTEWIATGRAPHSARQLLARYK